MEGCITMQPLAAGEAAEWAAVGRPDAEHECPPALWPANLRWAALKRAPAGPYGHINPINPNVLNWNGPD